MGILGSLFKAAADVVVTPIEVAKDVFTLGGVSTGQDEPYTAQRIRKLAKNLEQAYDDLGDL
jgi:hypothetical protein